MATPLICSLLDYVQSLGDDWDGAGAIAPSPETIAHAEQVLSTLQGWPLPHRAFALSTGEVVLEWDNGPSHFEIELSGPTRITWLRTSPTLPPAHGQAIDANVNRCLGEMIGAITPL